MHAWRVARRQREAAQWQWHGSEPCRAVRVVCSGACRGTHAPRICWARVDGRAAASLCRRRAGYGTGWRACAGDVVWCGGAPRGMRRRGAVRDKLRVTDGTGAELGGGCAGSARGCDLVGCAEWSAVALQWSACRVRSPRMCVAASDALCGAAPSDLLLDLLFDCMAWCGSVSLVTDFSARMRKSRNVWISANMRKSRNGCVAVL